MLPYLYFDVLVHKETRDPLETIVLMFLLVFVIWANVALIVKRLHTSAGQDGLLFLSLLYMLPSDRFCREPN